MALTMDDLLARQEIADVILRYARGIDRLDFDLVRSCYHPDAYDNHGSYAGDIDGFIEMCDKFLRKWSATMHFMGNMLIEVDGDVAKAETYAVAYHHLAEEGSDGGGVTGKDDVFGIRYVDRFEKRDGKWLIAHRVVATEWRRVEPVTKAPVRGQVGVWGTRDGEDVIDWIMSATAPA
ncbi:MAG: nuclear transport factor 2 family protein [Acidimicrobiales bacterium]